MEEQAQVLELLVMTDHVLWEVLDTLRTHDLNENTLAVSFEARHPRLKPGHIFTWTASTRPTRPGTWDW